MIRQKFIALTLIIFCFFSTTITMGQALPPSLSLELDTGRELYSVYTAYDIENTDFGGVEVFFNDEIKENAFSNVKDGVLWISIAAAKHINTKVSLANIYVKSSSGEYTEPKLKQRFLTLNGDKITDTRFKAEIKSAEITEGNLNIHIGVSDEMQRGGMIYAAAYDSDGMICGIDSVPITYSGDADDIRICLNNCAGAKSVKVLFWRDNLAPLHRELNKSL